VSVELRPLGVKCNIQCIYCYQNPQRDAGNIQHSYDLQRMMAAVEVEGGGFTLFGGEALMVPERDLETLWAWGLEKYGKNNIQTNGTLVTDSHIALFKRYKVHVGISLDGPAELNDARWAGSLAKTREATRRAHATLEQLCQEGVQCSLIVTLHRGNATPDKLPRMHEWFRRLERMGVRHARIHILEVDSGDVRERYALSSEENLEAFLSFARLEKELTTLKLDVFEDMRRLLRGQDNSTTCVWNACDPYTTRAVRGVEGHGERSNCGRTNKEGIDFTKAPVEGFERYLALYHTPQAHGGCQGCRFFLMCKGQCPGTAIDGDWRNRTEHCSVWMSLYECLEAEMVESGQVPLSLDPIRPRLEETFLANWAGGANRTIEQTLKQVRGEIVPPVGGAEDHGDWHGDHTDLG